MKRFALSERKLTFNKVFLMLLSQTRKLQSHVLILTIVNVGANREDFVILKKRVRCARNVRGENLCRPKNH